MEKLQQDNFRNDKSLEGSQASRLHAVVFNRSNGVFYLNRFIGCCW
ncbi:MAG: hypothetical protein LBP59_18945 [Planctomycetaceae bacterium]|nr:hypothetical protein [Planctomycetaceae bacterium]